MDDDCNNCKLKMRYDLAIKKVNEIQVHYNNQVKKVNKTIAKYTQKLDELEREK